MRFPAPVTFVLAAALAASGCASTAMSDTGAAPLQVYGDVERLEFAKDFQISLPARLAVADASDPWLLEHRDRLAGTMEKLAEDRGSWKDVNSVFAFEGDAAMRSARFEDLRQAAARQQADLMLVLRRRERTESSGNGLAILKILLIPMLFLPTEDVRTTLDLRAAVVDVRNGLVYATHDDQAVREFTASVVGEEAESRSAFDESWDRIVERMRTRVPEKIRALGGAAAR